MRSSTAVLVVLAVLSFAHPAASQPRPADHANAEAQQLFREVMSPFCPGLTLADCPSPNAFTLRGEIEKRLESGESRDAIVAELVTKYGTQILSDPSDTPIGTVVWGVPFALAGLAALGVAFVVRRATRTHALEPAVAVAGDSTLQSRLEDELDRID